MMRLRRCMAWWTVMVYLLAMGGPAVRALTCTCMHTVAERVHTLCGCCAPRAEAGHAVVSERDCCGKHGGVVPEYHTPSTYDPVKESRCVVAPDLPDALAAAVVVPCGCCGAIACDLGVCAGSERPSEPDLPHAGLRAPPARG